MQTYNKSLAVSSRYGQKDDSLSAGIDDIANTDVPATPSYFHII